MRFYNVQVLNQDGSIFYQASSHIGGDPTKTPDPSAPRIDFDIPISNYATVVTSGHLTIWGIGLATIGQTKNFFNADGTGKTISIQVGMAKGLPLANPMHNGPGYLGTIFQVWGNWINTNQTLDIVFQPHSGTLNTPKNLVLHWPAGQSLSQTLQNTLSAAFPNSKVNVAINPALTLANDETHFASSLGNLATYLLSISKKIINSASYTGVQVSLANNQVTVSDGTQAPAKTVPISFTDIIGQPVWIGAAQIQIMLVMRGDIIVGTNFTLPNTQRTLTQGAGLSTSNALTFSGSYQAYEVRLLGSSRQANAESWVTVVTANANTTGTSSS